MPAGDDERGEVAPAPPGPARRRGRGTGDSACASMWCAATNGTPRPDREPLPLRQPDEEGSDEARARRRRDEGHVRERRPRARRAPRRGAEGGSSGGRGPRSPGRRRRTARAPRSGTRRRTRATRPPSPRRATDVSSQEVSRPRTARHGRCGARPAACGGSETPRSVTIAVDERGRRDVEGRVERRDSRRREPQRLAGRRRQEEDLVGVAELDRDRAAVGTVRVERRRRRGDDERDAVGPAGEGEAVRPDLVRDVAVRGDPVGADDDRVDAARGDVRRPRRRPEAA